MRRLECHELLALLAFLAIDAGELNPVLPLGEVAHEDFQDIDHAVVVLHLEVGVVEHCPPVFAHRQLSVLRQGDGGLKGLRGGGEVLALEVNLPHEDVFPGARVVGKGEPPLHVLEGRVEVLGLQVKLREGLDGGLLEPFGDFRHLGEELLVVLEGLVEVVLVVVVDHREHLVNLPEFVAVVPTLALQHFEQDRDGTIRVAGDLAVVGIVRARIDQLLRLAELAVGRLRHVRHPPLLHVLRRYRGRGEAVEAWQLGGMRRPGQDAEVAVRRNRDNQHRRH